MLIYDIEIAKAIQGKNEQIIAGVEYCGGWNDHANMGISCICAYDYKEDRYRVFMEENLIAFSILAKTRHTLIGFNNIGFDNKVISANGRFLPDTFPDLKSYDILREIWIGAGLGPTFEYPSHTGYGLDAVIRANFPGCIGKTGHGASAPVLFQDKCYGDLIDYCLTDVWLTKKLMDLILDKGEIICPKTGDTLRIRKPETGR